MSNSIPPLEGLWSYESVAIPGSTPIPTVGLMLFHQGRFYQQAIGTDERLAVRLGQIHCGRYRVEELAVLFDVDFGVLTVSEREQSVCVRRNSFSQARFGLYGDSLTLAFEEEAQSLRRTAYSDVQVLSWHESFVVLADQCFLMAVRAHDALYGASGTLVREDGAISLLAAGTMTVSGFNVVYS